MRLTKKSPRTGALLFLPIVLAFGCTCAAETPAPAGTPARLVPLKAEQIVCVTLPDTKPGTKPIPSVNPVQLSKGKGHVAHWIFCGEGDLTITMKDPKDDPFVGGVDPGGKHVRSSTVHPKARIGKPYYHYTITLTTKDGVVFTNDPDIEIME